MWYLIVSIPDLCILTYFEVRDKQVCDIVAGDYGILWIIGSEQIKFTWNTGMVN